MPKRIKDISDLIPDPANANKGTERGAYQLEESLRNYGAGRSIVVDKHGVTIAGSKTLESAADMGLSIEVVKTDGKKLVVVQRTDLDLGNGDTKPRELAYADNRTSEVGLEWNPEQIAADLEAGVDLDSMFRKDELDEILQAVPNVHFPEPNKVIKNPPIPWTTFVHAHIDSIVACDFFTKPIFTLCGIRDAYVLVLFHLGSRKVYCNPSTYHPNSKWVMQQARNASMWMEDEGIDPRFLIRDRDRKYPDEFDAFWKEAGVRPIKTPPRAPMANAFCESYIGTTKRELLNHFICFSRGQLDYILRVWLKYYHEQRPHRGVGRDNTVLDKSFVPNTEGRIRCKTELGGILKSYYREAA